MRPAAPSRLPERLLAFLGIAGPVLIGWTAATRPVPYTGMEVALVVLAGMIPFTLAALVAWALRRHGDRKVAEYDAKMLRIAAIADDD
jgi:amino acid transporter